MEFSAFVQLLFPFPLISAAGAFFLQQKQSFCVTNGMDMANTSGPHIPCKISPTGLFAQLAYILQIYHS
jgi:hypothetical protein